MGFATALHSSYFFSPTVHLQDVERGPDEIDYLF